MKVTIERSALLKSLSHVQSVVEKRNTIPILSNVLMSAMDGRLSLTATDMDMELTEAIDAQVIVPGSVTVPAHTMHDIVRKLPDGAQVELDSGGDTSLINLKSGRSRFRLGCLPPDDYPRMAEIGFDRQFALPVDDLKKLIDRVRFAISTEETRYWLNGIFLHVHRSAGSDGEPRQVLRAVATDGHRLARVEAPLPEGADGMPDVIVPRKAVQEIRKLVDDTDNDIQVSLTQTKIRFSFDHVVLSSKLIDGTFPDYERVIPTGNDRRLEVDPKTFSAAVDRVATIATEKNRAIKLAMAPDQLTLSATSPDAGSATEEIAVAYQADQMEIGFNSRYLIEITNQIKSDGCVFALASATQPTVITDAADDSTLYVLMPMRV